MKISSLKNQYSLYTLLSFIVISIITLIMFIDSFYLYKTTKTRMINELKYHSDISISTLSYNIKSFIKSYSVNEYEELIENEMRQKDYLAIIVNDLKMAEIFGENSYKSGFIRDKNWQILKYSDKNSEHHAILEKSFFSKIYDIKSMDGQLIGSIKVFLSDMIIESRVQKLIIDNIIRLIVITLILIALLLIAIKYFVLEPIVKIINSLDKKDINGIPKDIVPEIGSKEIKVLSKNLNNMIEAIKESNSKLKILSDRYSLVLDGINDGIWDWDIKSNQAYFSPRWKSMLGYEINEIEDRPEAFFDLIHDDDKSKVENALKLHFQNPEENLYSVEIKMRCKDGNYKWVLTRGKTILDEEKNPIRMLGSHTDINKQKEIELEIIKEKNFIATVIDSANAIIAVIDSSGTMFKINRYGEEFTGYKENEIATKEFFWKRFLPLNIQDKVLGIIDNAKKGNIIEHFKNSWISKDGKERVFEWSNTLVKNSDGLMEYLVTIGIDVTEKELAHKELLKAKENAESANRAKSRFLANVSHEIRTPMNAILGYAQLLSHEDDLNSTHKKSINAIKRSGEHLLDIINDVLDMSKVEAGKIEIKHSSLDLIGMLKDLEVMFKMRTSQKNILFDLDIDKSLPRTIITDEGRVRQILINLLGNAVKFTKKGSIILHVKLVEKNGDNLKIEFRVEDSGIGIESNMLEKIFLPFEQAVRDNSESGTGLGLAISRELVKKMGGELKATSKIGKGSTFKFDIVATISKDNIVNEVDEDKLENVEAINSIQSPKTILVVDDVKDNRVILIAMLERVGFKTLEASSGTEAITIFNKYKPDIILMDLVMPDMNGIEATSYIRATLDGKNIPIIGVSASALISQREEMIEAGMNTVVSKPVMESTLYRALQSYGGVIFEQKKDIKSDLKIEDSLEYEVLDEESYELFNKAIESGNISKIKLLAKERISIFPNITTSIKERAEEFNIEAIREILNKSIGAKGENNV